MVEFVAQEILRLKMESQGFSSDDDISTQSDFDSDILEMVEKAGFWCLDNDCLLTLADTEG